MSLIAGMENGLECYGIFAINLVTRNWLLVWKLRVVNVLCIAKL